jgi:hypothetical protein
MTHARAPQPMANATVLTRLLCRRGLEAARQRLTIIVTVAAITLINVGGIRRA